MLPINSNIDKTRPIYALNLSRPNTPSLEDSFNYIYDIDFNMLIFKITQPDPNIARIWDQESAHTVVRYYQNYLWLLRKYSEQYPVIPPSIDIDEIWHHHILDTYKYHADCQHIFGQYLHHYPYYGMRGESDFEDLQRTFKITQDLHIQEFGTPILSFEVDEVELIVDYI